MGVEVRGSPCFKIRCGFSGTLGVEADFLAILTIRCWAPTTFLFATELLIQTGLVLLAPCLQPLYIWHHFIIMGGMMGGGPRASSMAFAAREVTRAGLTGAGGTCPIGGRA